MEIKMINCPACGKQISSQAKACINCGQPIDFHAHIASHAQESKAGEVFEARYKKLLELYHVETAKYVTPLLNLLGKMSLQDTVAQHYSVVSSFVNNLLRYQLLEYEVLQLYCLNIALQVNRGDMCKNCLTKNSVIGIGVMNSTEAGYFFTKRIVEEATKTICLECGHRDARETYGLDELYMSKALNRSYSCKVAAPIDFQGPITQIYEIFEKRFHIPEDDKWSFWRIFTAQFCCFDLLNDREEVSFKSLDEFLSVINFENKMKNCQNNITVTNLIEVLSPPQRGFWDSIFW
ncbi:hypothetical protein C5Q97_14810 [Victivallales bacterium CCUG 44730]|nr:hypothetical protein C5Q97_14810 [Victivallales bacterium CCUG 44730]